MAFTPDGRIVSGGSDKAVRIWDASSGECITTIKAKLVVYAVAVSPDGKTLAYSGRYRDADDTKNTVHFWDIAAGKAAGEWEFAWQRTPQPVTVESFMPRMEVTPEMEAAMAPNLREQALALAQAAYERVAPNIRPWPRSIWTLSYSADGKYLAAAGRVLGGGNIPNGGGGRWCEAKNLAVGGDLPEDSYAAAFAPTGSTLAITRLRAVSFRDTPGGDESSSFRLQCDWANAIAFADGGRTAIIAAGSYMHCTDLQSLKAKPVKMKTGIRIVTALAVSPDGRSLLAGGKPGTVELYEGESRTLRRTYDFGIGGVHALAMSPDGLTFAIAGDKGLIRCDLENP